MQSRLAGHSQPHFEQVFIHSEIQKERREKGLEEYVTPVDD